MKTNNPAELIIGLCLLAANSLLGAAFDSGSDGSYGAIDVTNSITLDMPSNGVFHCTTIRVRNGKSLSFRPNALNTPVYLLARGDVIIEGDAGISVDGQNSSGAIPGGGGPGGFAGGFGQQQIYPAGDGQGPGAGRAATAQRGVFSFAAGNNSNIYGNTLLVPLIGGSGGAGQPGVLSGGGGGGGAILIASSTSVNLVNNGVILARGGDGYGGGSGGAIRIVAPVVFGGNNFNQNFYVNSNGDGSYGRVRIDTLDRLAWRSLGFIQAGKWTVGTRMLTGLDDPRRLDIIEAAGTTIPVGTGSRVSITLPIGASTNQVVTVRASGFTNDVPITLVVIPENGASTRYPSVITVTGGNPGTNTMTVTLPVDAVTYLQVWSK